MIIKITDTAGEVYHINPDNIIYLKERSSFGLWKIALVNGDTILTKDMVHARELIDFLSRE